MPERSLAQVVSQEDVVVAVGIDRNPPLGIRRDGMNSGIEPVARVLSVQHNECRVVWKLGDETAQRLGVDRIEATLPRA